MQELPASRTPPIPIPSSSPPSTLPPPAPPPPPPAPSPGGQAIASASQWASGVPPALRTSCDGGGQNASGLCQVLRSKRGEETLSFSRRDTGFALTPLPSGWQVARMRHSTQGPQSTSPLPAAPLGQLAGPGYSPGFPPRPGAPPPPRPFPRPLPQPREDDGHPDLLGKRPPLRAHLLFPGPSPCNRGRGSHRTHRPPTAHLPP